MKEEKLEAAERKIAVSVGSYTEEEFQSAFSKLAYAALKYNKAGPGAIGLNAFEAETMPPHIFKVVIYLDVIMITAIGNSNSCHSPLYSLQCFLVNILCFSSPHTALASRNN